MDANFFPLEELAKTLSKFVDITPEQKDDLHRIGYDVNELQSELAQFINIQARKTLIRQRVAVMPENVRVATHALSMALSLESSPSYRNGCTDALHALLTLNCLDNDDLRRVAQLTDPNRN